VYARVWAKNNVNNGTFGICVTIPQPAPANDEPCGAIELTPGATCTYQTFTNESATNTSSVPAPVCAGFLGGDVWFKVVVPSIGALIFDTQAGTVIDGGMAVYSGSSCNGTLTLLDCDDNNGNGDMPRLTIGSLTPGDTVWVRVWENGNNNNGTFGICITLPPPPPSNDGPCTAVELAVNASCTYQTFTTVDATATSGVPAPGCANYQGGDVWFKVVVPAGGALTIDTEDGTMTDGGMAVYSGSCTNLTVINCDDDGSANGAMPRLVIGGLTPGDTVWVRVWEYGNDDPGDFGICVTVPPPAPSNDDPCNAIELIPGLTCNYQTFSNENATGTAGVTPPGCANYQGGDVWFKVVVPAEGGLIFDTDDGMITDGGMAIYRGSCAALNLIECDDDDSPNGAMSFISVGGLTPGDTIWVRVWEYGNDNNGSFGICVRTPPPPPANDNPCEAIELPVGTDCVYQTFTNENASGTQGVTAPGCAGYSGGDVWFKVVVPTGGALTFDSRTGVMTDGGMAIYSGSCAGLTLIDCDDNDSPNGLMPSITAGGLTPGDTIWIRMWENGNNNNGTFGICVKIPPPPPANDEPCTAIEIIASATCTYQTFTTENATSTPGVTAPGCANYLGSDVWFKVVVPSGGALIFDSQTGVITDGGMAIYSGTCGNLTLLECDDDDSPNGAMPSITAGGLIPGDTIWVRMWEYGNDNNGSFGICVRIPPPGPANDNPCQAIELIPAATCTYQTFTNESAFGTTGVPAPGCGGYSGGDVWFKVLVPAGGALTFNSQTGVMTDGAMAIYKGSCTGGLILLECDDDDSPNGLMPSITAGGLIPGDTVWVRFWENGNNNNGTFGICVTIPPPGPANDDPCNAITLTPAATCTYQTFTNAGAINTVGIPAPGCANYQGGDVWFQVTVPAEGGIIADTRDGVMTDGGMALYTGTCTDLTLVSCDDNNSVNGDMPTIYATGLTPGTTAWIRVWENGNNNNGTFGICITIPPPQPSTLSFNCVKDTTIGCDNCFSLATVIPNIHSSTSAYVVNPLSGPGNCFRPYVGPQEVGPSTNLGNDDEYTGVINLPFTFPFYGVNYNGLIASTNGYLSFDVSEADAFSHYSMLNDGGFLSATDGTPQDLPSALYDRALIMGPYHDINPFYTTSPDRQIKYNVTGIAPNRRWVLSFNKVPLYLTACQNLIENTHQIVLYEGSGVIEVFVFGKQICPGWNDGRAMIGIQNFDRNSAVMAPGRRASDPRWGTPGMNESWRFVPVGGTTLFKRVELYDTTGNLVATGDTSSVDAANLRVNFDSICPSTQTVGVTTYIVKTFYAQFNNAVGEFVSTDTIRVTRNAALNVTYGITNADCSGGNGSVIITPVGTAPYSYSSDAGVNFQADSSFILPAGTYNFSTKDSNNCTKDTVINILAISPVIAAYTVSPANCNGAADGSVVINILGGGGAPLQFSADAGATYQSDSSFALAAGIYTIRIRDNSGCIKDTTIEITEPSALQTPTTLNAALCNGANGSIIVNASGGTSPYEYSLDAGSNYQTSDSFSVVAGTYTIRTRDANGCIKDTTVVVTEPEGILTPAVITAVSCNGGSNGSIVINPAGGATPYEYSIDAGLTYQPANSFTVAAGSFTIRTRDANGCTKDTTVIVTEPDPILTPAVITAVSCNGETNGTIAINPAGGATPYEYSLDAGTTYQTANTFTVAAGSFSIRIKDANGCTKDTTIVVTEPDAILTPAVITAASCNGGTNGTIAINPAGGATPYEYSIDAGVTYQTANSFTVAAGSFTIRIKDVNGCTKDTTVIVTEPAAILTPSVITNVTCNGGTNGIIVINPAGGASPFDYSIDAGVTYQTANSFTVAAGSFTIRTRDANGCTKDTTVIVAEPAAILTPSVITNVTCNGSSNGAIVINPAGGATPYEYSIDAGVTYQTANSFTVAAGSFTIRTRDANGCTKDTTVIVTEPAAILTPAVITAVSCNGGTNGTIAINAAGGASPYEYSIDAGVTYQTANSFLAAAGSFTIRTRDANGCTKDTTVIVTQPTAITGTVTTSNASCTNATSGQITVTASGGTGALTYSTNGNSFQASGSFTAAQGDYTVSVRDANGCVLSLPATIGFAFDLTLQGRQDTVICGNGRIRLNTVSNAQTYSWSNGSSLDDATVANPFASPTVTTDYVLTAQLGTCTLLDTVRITVTAAPTVFAGNDASVVKGGDAQIVASVSNAAGFAWSPTTYLNNPNSLSPISVMPQQTITYILTATNAEGCSIADSVTITVLPYCIKAKNAFTPNGDGVNDTWMVYDQYDCLKNIRVQVFNRYGSKVFESTNYRNDWRGTFGGKSLPDATYYYVLDYTLLDGTVLQLRGDVTILR
jgi:gliding motility-associated-like protein